MLMSNAAVLVTVGIFKFTNNNLNYYLLYNCRQTYPIE